MIAFAGKQWSVPHCITDSARTHAHTHTRTHAHTHTRTHNQIQGACARTCAHPQTLVDARANTHRFLHAPRCGRTHTHSYTHTHTNLNTCKPKRPCSHVNVCMRLHPCKCNSRWVQTVRMFILVLQWVQKQPFKCI